MSKLIGPPGGKDKKLNHIQNFSYKKTNLNMWCAKQRPFFSYYDMYHTHIDII